MQHSFPLTQHEKNKKELLALDAERLLLVTALLLNGGEGTVLELNALLKLARQQSAAIGQWTAGRTSRRLTELAETPFVDESPYGFRSAKEWENVMVFAADGLGMERLDALVHGARLANSFPPGGQPTNHWRKDYAEIILRCIHKILLGNTRDFEQLYAELARPLSWSQPARDAGKVRIDAIIGTPDWSFWKKRPAYFQWSCLTENQHNYRRWTTDTARELERMLTPMLERTDAEGFLPDIENLAVLGLHHFRNRRDTFSSTTNLSGFIALMNDRVDEALRLFSRGSDHTVDRPVSIVDLVRIAFLYGRKQLTPQQLEHCVFTPRSSELPRMVSAFIAYALGETGQQEEAEELLTEQFSLGLRHPLEWLVGLCAAAWLGIKLRPSWLEPLYGQLQNEVFVHLPWVEAEIICALRTVNPHRTVNTGARPPVRREAVGAGKVLGLLPVRPAWEYALRQLRRPTAAATRAAGPDLRTIWIVDFDEADIYCKEQKMGARGWSKGRRLKWHELITPKYPAALDPADAAAIAGLVPRDGRRLSASMAYHDDALSVDFGRMLYELVEHPRVLLGEKRRIPVELLRGEPELRVTESPGGILLRFDPPVEARGYVWKKETPTRYRIYHLTEDQARMAWAIGNGVEVPQDQRPLLEQTIEKLRPAVTVQSTFDLIDDDLERIVGSLRPCFHLLPFGPGYKVELYAKPLPEEPFYFKPGDGLARTIIVVDDGRRILERNLKLETERAAAAVLACPTLCRTPHEGYEWAVADTTAALRILLELRRLVGEGGVTIEHPKGEKLKIVGQVGSDELAIRVGKQRDWFEVDGKLTVDEDKVLRLEALCEHLKTSDNPFVELEEGAFVALTDELRDRILELEGLLYRKGNKLQLPTLAAGVFSELADDLDDVEYDEAWTASLERIRTADKIRPRVPKSFRTALRDYQKDGFRWMMRLAAWGVGGCLADDMGLGKTVQALAMLSARADCGPSLVIAPASVTRNWRRETERFAPGLLPVLIASRTDAAHLSDLRTGDLALISYGLLPFIGDELRAMEWGTIVIDEAQAIKNAATKRAKIVQNLRGEFKLATTGTPIENHLGELWSLFRFLNPGLLSSKSAFNDKFNKPIARDGDEERRSALKNLVKPFILRRRKDEVLTELPPKTEIVLEVELSEEEKALYEAMRRQAVKEIAQADEQHKRFTVLAQLTKLRQAACHPRLVRPNSRVGSAKLELVGETLLEILESGHKALVFSQFVKHLRIVENWVKGQGIAYQYLDGSTPGAKREQSVNAFQNGEGEVFLISLKAGGTGLNLTAADYVLHLDPWWNPAAEDQASDRAHRIGQQRPVTVYRFVSQGTIEEQIIALHAGKRDLADQILSGTGSAGALRVEEVLGMIGVGG